MATIAGSGPVRPAAAPRRFRVVERPGLPHRFLDGSYETVEEAWGDAMGWWRGCCGELAGTCILGVEVSTVAGEWRTLRMQPCRGPCRRLEHANKPC
jgi:hypothetical protein